MTSPAEPIDSSTVLLNDGRRIPQLGFGTYLIPPNETTEAVEFAIAAGYRHVDTASYYRNEAGVGQAVRASGIDRDKLWITSKLPIGASTADEVHRAIDKTVAELGSYIDLYLIHWPMPSRGNYPAVWRALQKAQSDGRVGSIGVSNFHQRQLHRILDNEGVRPAVNQIEVHPYLPNTTLAQYCVDLNIAVEAWSPLGAGSVLHDVGILALAEEAGRTVAQVVLRWHIQRGHIVLPKASSPERIQQNASVYDFTLTTEQMSRLDRLDRGESGRTGPNPESM
ncbi:aldo/keto reductase [Glaciihabitans sp. dw_435]|uniref:aldo/keto reductase n=1 Tax=Glaciihabitans sp. dw_435 TaxID=2720081 RepID=UPI0027DC33B7|nr:aldo/keto reductase [Glaciihabitans sp. dw_435]